MRDALDFIFLAWRFSFRLFCAAFLLALPPPLSFVPMGPPVTYHPTPIVIGRGGKNPAWASASLHVGPREGWIGVAGPTAPREGVARRPRTAPRRRRRAR